MTLTSPAPAATTAGSSTPRLATHYVDGALAAGAGEREVERVSPVTGEPSLVLVPATPDEVEAATTGLGATGRTLAGSTTALDVVRREPHGVVAVVTPWNDPFPEVRTGGLRVDEPGALCPPTVLDACTADMDVMTEETFGPVAAITRVPDFDTGLALANEGRYGLAATVLTPRLDHALLAAEELEVGTVKTDAVFGGGPGGSADPCRDSGAGAGYGPDLLPAMTVLKAVHLEPAVVA